VSVHRISKQARAANEPSERADMVGTTVRHLEGKAREYALKEFFTEKVPSVRGEKVVKQTGMPPDLEIV
jgi:hypothetical protein